VTVKKNTFLGLGKFPDNIQEALIEAQHLISCSIPPHLWENMTLTADHNLHITLKYMGYQTRFDVSGKLSSVSQGASITVDVVRVIFYWGHKMGVEFSETNSDLSFSKLPLRAKDYTESLAPVKVRKDSQSFQFQYLLHNL